LDKGIILIRKNKTGKERYVPMSLDVLKMCRKYYSAAGSIFVDRTYFFPSPDGAPYCRRWLAKQFRMIWKRVKPDISEADARIYPVVYDLRQRYATTMMMQWLNENKDLDAKLPYLSAYMGHTRFSDTAYYIHLLPENLIRSPAIDWNRFSHLIPEVVEYE
jgi:integrase